MSNYTEFEGVNLITDPDKKTIAEVLVKNELGGVSNVYQLDNANTSNSGYSFGGNQMDLSKNANGREIFSTIIKTELGDNFYNSIKDRVIQAGNPNILTQQEQNQINSALSSNYGKQLNNQAFVDEVNTRSSHIDDFARLLNTTFTNDVKIALVDYDNQFYIDFTNTGSASMRTKLQNILNQNGEITLEDVENSVRSTGYYNSSPKATKAQENRIQDTQIKSYHPEYLNRFDCAEKLEKQVYFLFALDREPLNKIDYQSNVEVFTVHREIMRNLHKIVGITKSGNGEYIDASGIKDGKLFDTKDKNFLKQILDSKSYVKFYSFFDEGSGNYQEFYIPIKNYNLIKDHLLVLDKDSKKMVKGKVSNFAISFSAMLHLISPEVIGKVRPMENKQFPWIEEISSTPYYSTIHPLSRFVAKDNVINDPLLMMGYGYPSRMFKSNVLLTKILQETNILPKNFSIIPTIEKSLKSGNKEYCGTIANPQGLLIVEKLHGKEFKVSKTYMKYCFDKVRTKTKNSDMYIPANDNGAKLFNL